MTRRILFVSNGLGEDLIASRIIAELPTADVGITAYPLVGLGAYPPGIALLDPRREMPSSGFSFRPGMRGLGADLAAGIIGLWLDQLRTLKAQRGQYDLVAAVGDVYCLWMAHLVTPRPVLVATADSARIAMFGTKSRWALRRCARQVFARDPETAAVLTKMGLAAEAPGNVMMDLLQYTGETFGLPSETPVVALLPGSRPDAPANAALLAEAARAIAERVPHVRYLLAVAPSVPASAIRERLAGFDEALVHSDQEVAVGGARIRLTTAFADAVACADVVIGMAGTASEQSAGLGRPVVAFPGPGAQFGPDFLVAQQRLLGEALVPARDWRQAADAVVKLLRDPAERQRRGAIGIERMGPPGGAQRIAQALLVMSQNG